MEKKWQHLAYRAIMVTTIITLMGCTSSQFASYGGDVGDSLFIYIIWGPTDMRKTHRGGINVEQESWSSPYRYYLKGDSIEYSDDFDEFEKCQVKRTKEMLVIYRNPKSTALFRKKGVDSVVLYKISESYLDKRINRNYK